MAVEPRVIVLGGLGLFGSAMVQLLRTRGVEAHSASRRPQADLQVDAEDADSLRENIRAGDLVIDAAGPFQARSNTLLQQASKQSFHVVDINDDLGYAKEVVKLKPSLLDAGITVISSASSVTAIVAAVIEASSIESPVSVDSFLAPASRHTANKGSAISLIQSLGAPVEALEHGKLVTVRGWSRKRTLVAPPPLGRICGRLFESADAIYLPMRFPSLRAVAMYVDANTPGVNWLLTVAARSQLVRSLLLRFIGFGTRLSRMIGSAAGGLAYEIGGPDGKCERFVIMSAADSYTTAILPAVLAAERILAGETSAGLVSPNDVVSSVELFSELKQFGIELRQID